MHGDETLGRQLLLYLAEYLAEGYGRNERVTRILDTTEVYLMPTMNPDGFARSVTSTTNNDIYSYSPFQKNCFRAKYVIFMLSIKSHRYVFMFQK